MQIKKIPFGKGEISVAGDKSISHRAVMLGSLCLGTTEIYGFLSGADCLATIDCFQKMGVDIQINPEKIIIEGKGLQGLSEPSQMLYTGNSGTTTRLLCGLLAGQNFSSQITGDASIEKRPMNRVISPLALMGAEIHGEYCPLSIIGKPLKGINYKSQIPSAQIKTAILLAGLYAQGETVVSEPEKSRDHTELMLKSMGANLSVDGLSVTIGQTKELHAQKINVCGDISSAAFFMVLGVIMPNSEVTIKNVGINPTRTGIIDVLKEMNAKIKIENIRISNEEPIADITISTSNLKGTIIGGDIIPRLIDELPILAVAAAFAEGETIIKDAQELKVKETNRIYAVVTELKKCGVDITETDDGMIIRGGNKLHGADFTSYGDHRMAMSAVILAQMCDGESTIDDEKCIDVSFPNFFDCLYQLGR